MSQCRRATAGLFLFGFCINALYLVTPLYMLQIFDRVLTSYRIETLLVLTLMAGFALAVMGLLEAVRARILNRIGGWLENALSAEAIAASVNQSLKGRPAGAQPLRDLALLRGFITTGLKSLLDIPWSPLFIVALCFLHLWLGLFTCLVALLLFGLAVLGERLAKRLALAANADRLKNEDLADQAIRNADVLTAMGMLPQFLGTWNQRLGGMLQRDLGASDASAVIFGLSRFLRMFAQAAILGLGALFVVQGDLSPGGMVAGSILLGRALAPIEQVIAAWRGLLSAKAAKSRLEALLSNRYSVADPMSLPRPQGYLNCENLWYRPDGAPDPILKGISFALKPGGVLALTGPSGSGKTTLCKLLTGAWQPTRGFVRLDGAEFDQFDTAFLGKHIGYLPQNVELFSGTVKENIGRLQGDAKSDDVIAAAKLAGIHETILALPNGYDTVIGVEGLMLSGGQRQSIGLARAFYQKPSLLVLDEPNANLDAAGEDALLSAIAALKAWPASVVLVTHNLRLLEPVDDLLVLQAGHQVMWGARDKVLQAVRSKPVLVAGTEQQVSKAG